MIQGCLTDERFRVKFEAAVLRHEDFIACCDPELPECHARLDGNVLAMATDLWELSVADGAFDDSEFIPFHELN